jgi:uncharacterized protein YcgL (UPF0745 family)
MKQELCNVYKSRRKEETYLYVSIKDDLKRVPQELLETFGTPDLVTKLLIKEDRQLARAEAPKVLAQIEEKGFYLQLPPPKEEYMLDLFHKLDKE